MLSIPVWRTRPPRPWSLGGDVFFVLGKRRLGCRIVSPLSSTRPRRDRATVPPSAREGSGYEANLRGDGAVSDHRETGMGVNDRGPAPFISTGSFNEPFKSERRGTPEDDAWWRSAGAFPTRSVAF
ncbi:hypothetical protein EYF80_062926 [Liparis tanakae]|uniref:Uncharacterized protein n=1 Tax=Liparis tanakae TaxID=230148 RepID=A0A4Z2EF38_9TELE|nr:hypothetical protein EYF80_062926 [Liparis tanakae]